MYQADGKLLLSATDLSNFLACEHLSLLDRRAALGGPGPPKFQGQEAPIVIYSMATSSPEEAPRGMAFLYSPNRLNVATSRAQCLAIVVANPSLFVPSCRTPEQLRLANAFCRFRELAPP